MESLFLFFIHFLNKYLLLRLLLHKMKSQHGLGPVESDDGFFLPGPACGLNLIYKVSEDLTVEITAPPVKSELTALFCGLECTLVDLLEFGKGELFLTIVEVASIRAGRRRSDQRLMVTEDAFVIQIKIIIADADRTVFVFSESIVEGGIQMIILAVDPDNIPGMAVFDPLLRIVSADGDDAPDTKSIAENLYGFGDSLADPHTVAERTDDLMRIRLFQLVIADIFADKVMDIFFLIQLGKLLCRAYKLVYAGLKRCIPGSGSDVESLYNSGS